MSVNHFCLSLRPWKFLFLEFWSPIGTGKVLASLALFCWCEWPDSLPPSCITHVLPTHHFNIHLNPFSHPEDGGSMFFWNIWTSIALQGVKTQKLTIHLFKEEYATGECSKWERGHFRKPRLLGLTLSSFGSTSFNSCSHRLHGGYDWQKGSFIPCQPVCVKNVRADWEIIPFFNCVFLHSAFSCV